MTTDQRARLRRVRFGRSDHEHDGRSKRDDDQRVMRCKREPLHGADRDGGPDAGNGSGQRIVAIVAADRIDRPLAPIPSHFEPPQTKRGGRSLCRPFGLERTAYFRLVTAVRSAESLAIPAAPHQLDSKPPGLIAETL